MMALGGRLRQGLGLVWRSVQSAVRRSVSSFGLSSRTEQVFAKQGIPTSMVDPGVIDELTGYAAGIDNASRNLAAAAPSDWIDATMIGQEPYSMGLDQFAASPRYRIRLGMTVEGQTQMEYRWVTGIADVGMTKQDLMNLLQIEAAKFAVGTIAEGGFTGPVSGISEVAIVLAPPLG